MFWYLATPYSKFAAGTEAAFIEASKQAAILTAARVPVFSPIAHTHPVAIHGNLDPLDHTIWLEADRTFMEAAKGIIVCQMNGWAESYGVKFEIEAFERMQKPCLYMTPGVVPCELLLKRQVVGLVGYATAGKDAAAAALVQDGWLRVAFADAVREALLELDPLVMSGHKLSELLYRCDFQEAKRHGEVRRLLQRLGTEAGRNIHGQDCWVKIAERKIEATTANVVLTDVRFSDEAAFVRSLGGKLVYIERPGVGPVNGHVSDAGISALKTQCDVAIHNEGTVEELYAKIREVV
jgi:hypothetical protein